MSRDKLCTQCGRLIKFNRPDPCFQGPLPGVEYACCGHGDPDKAYIAFVNGIIVRGFDLVEEMGTWRKLNGPEGEDEETPIL